MSKRVYVSPGVHKWVNPPQASIYNYPVLVTIPCNIGKYSCKIDSPTLIDKSRARKTRSTQLEMHALLITKGYIKSAEDGNKWIYSKSDKTFLIC